MSDLIDKATAWDQCIKSREGERADLIAKLKSDEALHVMARAECRFYCSYSKTACADHCLTTAFTDREIKRHKATRNALIEYLEGKV